MHSKTLLPCWEKTTQIYSISWCQGIWYKYQIPWSCRDIENFILFYVIGLEQERKCGICMERMLFPLLYSMMNRQLFSIPFITLITHEFWPDEFEGWLSEQCLPSQNISIRNFKSKKLCFVRIWQLSSSTKITGIETGVQRVGKQTWYWMECKTRWKGRTRERLAL